MSLHDPFMSLVLREVQRILPDGYILEYQLEDGMWHVVAETIRHCAGGSEQSAMDYEKWEKVMMSNDEPVYGEWPHLSKAGAMRLAQEELCRYSQDHTGKNGYVISVDEIGKVSILDGLMHDATVASPEGQQTLLPSQRHKWTPILPEASESSLRALQWHSVGDMYVNAQIDGDTLLYSLNHGFADALRKLESEAGEFIQGLEQVSKGIAALAEDMEGIASFTLLEAIEELDADPDDSYSRVEFFKALAIYMLDNNLELSGLQIAMEYEVHDRMVLEQRRHSEQEPVAEQKQSGDDYYDKVWE